MENQQIASLSIEELDAVSGGMKNNETAAWQTVMNGMIQGIWGHQDYGHECVNLRGDVPAPCPGH